ncbi:MAG: Nif3-like dinuclear metal center hexameric protein [Armatimonadetes bacterium]|nr:Nif3-like dinuclear metal center hexameric protein [Armatimonadota bacterium]
MHKVRDIVAAVEKLAPMSMMFSWDRAGLQIGGMDDPVTKIVVSLDASMAAAEYAIDQRAQMLLSHHPLVWEPLKTLTPGKPNVDVALRLIKHGIAFLGAHTNWDAAPGGINCTLAEKLGLRNVRTFGETANTKEFKIVVFAPGAALQSLIDAMSQAGAGVIGNYERCAFFSTGHGTFRGNENSNPTVGRREVEETVEETRIEMRVASACLDRVLAAMKSAHPYEEPAFDVMPLEIGAGYPIGRVGELDSPMIWRDLQNHIDLKLDVRSQIWLPQDASEIKTIALVGGGASGYWRQAKPTGADAYLTGEIKQDDALAGTESGLVMIQAGHYATEQPGMAEMAKRLRAMTGVDTVLFEPEPGTSGRPA